MARKLGLSSLPGWVRRVFGEPLVQFLFIGLIFYALGQNIGRLSEEQQAKTIVITQPVLLEFIQYRSRNFDTALARQRLDAMSDTQRDALIEDFLREEVLYREAQALGLAQTDYVIRRRLVQKLNFITEGIVRNMDAPARADVEAYYAANNADYHEPARITFSHVFFDKDRHNGPAGAAQAARAYLPQLRKRGFSDAVGRGDRFAFETNYVARAQPDILASFGTSFTERIFALPNAQWQGPVESLYGAHLVFIAEHTPARQPALDDIYDVVAQDTARALLRQRQEGAIQDMMDAYHVRLELE